MKKIQCIGNWLSFPIVFLLILETIKDTSLWTRTKIRAKNQPHYLYRKTSIAKAKVKVSNAKAKMELLEFWLLEWIQPLSKKKAKTTRTIKIWARSNDTIVSSWAIMLISVPRSQKTCVNHGNLLVNNYGLSKDYPKAFGYSKNHGAHFRALAGIKYLLPNPV